MDDGRLSKRVMVKKGWGGQEKKWATCVESEISDIQQNWKHAARDAQSWTEIVSEGGRRVMTEWRKEEVQNPPGEENRQIAREPSTNVAE